MNDDGNEPWTYVAVSWRLRVEHAEFDRTCDACEGTGQVPMGGVRSAAHVATCSECRGDGLSLRRGWNSRLEVKSRTASWRTLVTGCHDDLERAKFSAVASALSVALEGGA